MTVILTVDLSTNRHDLQVQTDAAAQAATAEAQHDSVKARLQAFSAHRAACQKLARQLLEALDEVAQTVLQCSHTMQSSAVGRELPAKSQVGQEPVAPFCRRSPGSLWSDFGVNRTCFQNALRHCRQGSIGKMGNFWLIIPDHPSVVFGACLSSSMQMIVLLQ